MDRHLRAYTRLRKCTHAQRHAHTHIMKKMKSLFWNIRLILLLSQHKNMIDEICITPIHLLELSLRIRAQSAMFE